MKHFLPLMVFAALTSPAITHAESVVWDDLCARAKTKALTIKTLDGVRTRGTCFVQTESTIALRTNDGSRTLPRDAISSVRIDNFARTHCFSDLAELSILWTIFCFPVGPALFAGGTPFCAVYDGINRLTGSHRITII